MVIIDTSVAYKFFAPEEEGYKEATGILRRHIEGSETILIPDLLLYELANAWSTKTQLKTGRIAINLNDLKVANFEIERVNFNLIAEAIELSRSHRISVYDACYAVIAKRNHCTLVTADDKFAEKLNLPFIKKLSDLPKTTAE